MSGFDNMLHKYIRKSLENELGKKNIAKIQQELRSWYQIDLDEAIIQFEKLDRVLASIYGKIPARALEKRFMAPILDATSSKKGITTFTIKDSDLRQLILAVIGDDSFRKIFDAMNGKTMTLLDILEKAKLDLSEQSQYRKADVLIKNGLILESGNIVGKGGRNVKTYQKMFEEISITVDKGNEIQVVMGVDNKLVLEKSLIMSTVFSS